jgi:hypothetical protein
VLARKRKTRESVIRRVEGRGNREPIVGIVAGGRKLDFGLTSSAPESAPLPTAASREGPAREIPAVIPPFLGLLGLLMMLVEYSA